MLRLGAGYYWLNAAFKSNNEVNQTVGNGFTQNTRFELALLLSLLIDDVALFYFFCECVAFFISHEDIDF